MLNISQVEINLISGGNCDCYRFAYGIIASGTFYDNHGQPGSMKQKCQYYCCVGNKADFFTVSSYDTNLCNPPRIKPTNALFRLGLRNEGIAELVSMP